MAAAAAPAAPRSARADVPWHAHEKAALLAAGVGVVAAFAAGALDPIAFTLAALALALAWSRGRDWAIARFFERPRLFTVVSAVYLPVFFLDLFFSGGPVGALDRLVVFLLIAEVLSGNARQTHRPILLGLLLLVSTAAETTDIWFALPMAAFVLAAISAQLRTTMIEHQPAGEAAPRSMRLIPLVSVTVGSLALGTLIFFSIPRIGAGWGRQLATQKSPTESNLETGLADSVRLGTVGKVKVRRRIAFKATLSGTGRVDPESIYWRARPFSRWTGQGWIEDRGDIGVVMTLPVGRAVRLPGEEASETPGLIAEIEMRLDKAPALIAPGRPTWIKTPTNTQLVASSDGALTNPYGRIPRSYEVAVRALRTPLVEPMVERKAGEVVPAALDKEAIANRNLAREYPGSGEDAQSSLAPVYLETGTQPAEVLTWAHSVASEQTDPLRVARGFVADLSKRRYSLDTRGVDPSHPIASFLHGAPAHCEYFASAMVLGLRARGIPARVVGGFLGADRATFGREYVVREARAHMWVEAHIPGSGWTTFDPTPEEGRTPPSEWQSALQDGWERVVLTWDAIVIGFDISDQADILVWGREILIRGKGLIVRHAILVAFVLGTAAALVLGLIAGQRGRWVTRGFGGMGIPEAYRRLLVHAARRGERPAPGETAREFARRVGGALGDPKDVEIISFYYERERFGDQRPTAGEAATVREALGRLLRSQPAPRQAASALPTRA
jgi:hypothetical protein